MTLQDDGDGPGSLEQLLLDRSTKNRIFGEYV